MRPPSLPPALLASLLLHGALVAVVAIAVTRPEPKPPASERLVSVEVASSDPMLWDLSMVPWPNGAPNSEAAQQLPRSSARISPTGEPLPPQAAELARANASVLARSSGLGTDAPTDWEQSPARQPPEASSPAEREPRSSTGTAPRLTLRELGVEGDGIRFWDAARATLPSPRQRAEERRHTAERNLELSMQQEVVERDSFVGLGPQGSVLAALRREARASLAPVNSHAVVLATLTSSGEVDLHLVSASKDFAAWGQVAQRAREALRKTALKMPAGARGLELEIRIDSRQQLPSGADPGLAVDLLGLPLRQGKGKRSSRLSLLEPKLELKEEEVQMPGGTVKLPRLKIGINILGLAADPADLGARARRVVRVRVQRQRPL